jgi:hypothetical protein
LGWTGLSDLCLTTSVCLERKREDDFADVFNASGAMLVCAKEGIFANGVTGTLTASSVKADLYSSSHYPVMSMEWLWGISYLRLLLD